VLDSRKVGSTEVQVTDSDGLFAVEVRSNETDKISVIGPFPGLKKAIAVSRQVIEAHQNAA
jgi:hypothetical protein